MNIKARKEYIFTAEHEYKNHSQYANSTMHFDC